MLIMKKLVLVFIFGIFALIFCFGFRFTGNSISVGTVNLTVDTLASINFTIDSLNWGVGGFSEGATYALLISNGTVESGSWVPVSSGFVIENNGNVALNFSLDFGKNASELIGGTSPEYKFKVSNVESDSCIPAGGFSLDEWSDISSDPINICSNFSSSESDNSIRIDVYLKIPIDTTKIQLDDTLIASYEEAG